MRHLILILASLTLIRPLWGDDSFYNYGVEGGVNLSNISTSNASTNTLTKLGGIGGLYWEFFPSHWLSLVPGGYVVGKGYKEDSTKSVVLNYFQVRALGRISLFRSFSSKFFIDLGPSADFAFQKGTQNFPTPPQMTSFKDFDASLIGGVGFEMNILKTTRLAFNVKYIYGLLDLVKDSTSSVRSNGILFTTAIQFSTEAERMEPTEERAKKYIEKRHSLDPVTF